ncbi:FtsW/RodA/SpoVE family cell cycle protein [Priestia endophytica]|uniref:FtsW/RodA/SpoVE family cell cycle protein n=1 Tax=Priestia endophytica TaxID=135735 RepID=UPI0022816474|nr:FtsW/RodA/SpoVE family cell cycle protein [Priestia endophytica]MCY8231107.1 FtsW/RodA/SpoVE family cell cycle protein [Priestia endophytica]
MDMKEAFLNRVTAHIRSKEAKKVVRLELYQHMRELSSLWEEEGMTKEEAEKKTIEQMGSPAQIGKKMNKLHRPIVDWFALLTMISLIALSFLTPILFTKVSSSDMLKMHSIGVSISVCIVGLLMFFNYEKLKNKGLFFYIVGCLFLLYMYFFGTVKGSRTFVSIGPVFSSAYITFPLFLLSWASFTVRNRMSFLASSFLLVFPFFMFIRMGYYGPSLLYILLALCLTGTGKWKRKGSHLYIWFVVLILSAYAASLLRGTTLPKIIDLWREKPYQLFSESFYLLSRAGWFGNGVLPSTVELNTKYYVDLIFVPLTYMYGWLFSLFLLFLMSFLLFRMYRTFIGTREPFGRALTLGVIILYGVTCVWGLLMGMGKVPFLNVSVPFVSYGVISFMINASFIGFVLSVYRWKNINSLKE